MTRKTNPMQGNNNTIHDRKVIFFFVLFSIGIIGFGFQYLHKGLYSLFVIEIPDFLQKQTNIVEKWLEDNGTLHISATKSIREKTIHLEVLKKCSKLTEEFLL